MFTALSTGKEEGDPVKKMGMVVNLAERTVTISGVSVTTHIDRADAASISFNATEVPYSFSAGGLRGTGTMTVWASSTALPVPHTFQQQPQS